MKYFDLKLYRKFLILAVLLGSLFVNFSVNRASAVPCCGPLWEACDNAYLSCLDYCDYHYQQNPARHAQCVGICEDEYLQCYVDAEPCNHGC